MYGCFYEGQLLPLISWVDLIDLGFADFGFPTQPWKADAEIMETVPAKSGRTRCTIQYQKMK
jgi:hypothetical protein